MAKSGINYLFPPDQIDALPTWRFVLHFKAPTLFRGSKLKKAVAGMKSAEWKIVQFPFGLDELEFDGKAGTVGVPVEVTPERRMRPGSLQDYESDFWRVCGHMIGAGFGDVFYEAIDWKDEAQ